MIDIYVERNPIDGSLLLSAIVGGYRVHRQYYGYSVAQAKRMFREEMK